jgi:hypothetical protein
MGLETMAPESQSESLTNLPTVTPKLSLPALAGLEPARHPYINRG